MVYGGAMLRIFKMMMMKYEIWSMEYDGVGLDDVYYFMNNSGNTIL